MKKFISLLLVVLMAVIMLTGCSMGRKALEEEAISIYDSVNGVGAAERSGFSDSVKGLSDDELHLILGH